MSKTSSQMWDTLWAEYTQQAFIHTSSFTQYVKCLGRILHYDGNSKWQKTILRPKFVLPTALLKHYSDVLMGAMASLSQITSLTIVYSNVYSGADQRNHQSSASLTSVRETHRSPVISPHKWPVTRKMFPFDDVIMILRSIGKLGFHLNIKAL